MHGCEIFMGEIIKMLISSKTQVITIQVFGLWVGQMIGTVVPKTCTQLL